MAVSPASTQHAPPPVRDVLGRSFGSLRLSVTPNCNFACTYCNPEKEPMGGAPLRPPAFYLELVEQILKAQPLHTVHITGGEPGLYRRLPELVRGLCDLGIPRVSMTTNGFRLAEDVESLLSAGLSDCNISLDALTRRGFRKLTGVDARDRVLAAILASVAAGLPVKVNCTVMRRRNEREVVWIFAYLSRHGIVVRFLELMRMGPLVEEYASHLADERSILERIALHFPFRELERTASSTARYFETDDGRRFGVIANHSRPFCGDCDRLRLAHDGRVFGCISSSVSQDLVAGRSLDEVRDVLTEALAQKQLEFQGSNLSMQAIGG